MRLLFRFAAVLALAYSGVAARADTYSIVKFFYPQHGAGNYYGLDDYGNASIYGPVGCGFNVSLCYANFSLWQPDRNDIRSDHRDRQWKLLVQRASHCQLL